jgi:hypothetical protein
MTYFITTTQPKNKLTFNVHILCWVHPIEHRWQYTSSMQRSLGRRDSICDRFPWSFLVFWRQQNLAELISASTTTQSNRQLIVSMKCAGRLEGFDGESKRGQELQCLLIDYTYLNSSVCVLEIRNILDYLSMCVCVLFGRVASNRLCLRVRKSFWLEF